MISKERNIIERNQKKLTSSNRYKNAVFNKYYDRISAMNSPLSQKMLTEINIEKKRNSKNDKNFGSLVYKSIFNSSENNDNFYINDNTDIFSKENDKQQSYILSSSSNKKNDKNNKKYNVNLKKNIQSTQNNISNNNNNNNKINLINNDYNEEEEDMIYNRYNSVLNPDIKYQKQYTYNNNNNKKNEFSQKLSFLSGNKDYNITSQNSNLDILSKNAKSIKFQKSQGNLNENIILDKEEFMKNIKEIDDLELLDLNDYNNELFKEKSNNKNIYNNNVYENTNRNLNNDVNYLSEKNLHKQQTSTYNNNNNSIINNNFYKQKTLKNKTNIKNINNNINNNRNISTGRHKANITNIHDKNNEEKNIQLSDLTTTNSNNYTKINIYGLDINSNSSLKNKRNEKMNNYNLLTDNNEPNSFSTLSKGEIDINISKKRNINLNGYSNKSNYKKRTGHSIQTNIKKYKDTTYNMNHLDNLNEEAFLSIRSNNNNIRTNNKYNNISNFSESNNNIEIKEENEKLKKELKRKNNIIEKNSKLINEYKKQINALFEKNKKLVEDSKKNQSTLLQQIKEYQNEIYILKKNNYEIIKNNVRSSKNENLGNNNVNMDEYNKKMNELKEEIENYKVENNKLKMLVIKYKYHPANGKFNSGNRSQIDDNFFYSTKGSGSDKKLDKKSYSVSKSKKRLRTSFFSKKNFEEDNYDLASDNDNHNNVKSFMLY